MRVRPLWISFSWLLGCAAGVSAQSAFVSVSEEMPRVEISVGAAAMEQGPGRDFERQFARLGFDRADGRLQTPNTSPPAPLPGAFLQVHVASSAHTMVGFILSDVETDTEGVPADGGAAVMRARILTRGLELSYRPNAWLKVGGGPALHRRLADLQGGPVVRGEALGWLASAEAKFARGKRTPAHAPPFGYVIVQYRGVPPMSLPAMTISVPGRTQRTVLQWPAQTVRTSHWMFGLGVGFEI